MGMVRLDCSDARLGIRIGVDTGVTDTYPIYFILLTGSICAAGILKTASVHLPSISVHYPFPPVPPGDTGIVGCVEVFRMTG